jgi:regulator of sirC expression with transglutaminase-like and TPR domain
MIGNSSIEALVQLIDDPDELIYEHVRGQLLSIGSPALPFLESPWDKRYNQFLFQSRVETIIREIQFEEIKMQIKFWLDSPEKDLLDGAIIVARYANPDLDEDFVKKRIENIRRDIWLELNDNQTAFEQIKIFNSVFFGVHGFQGDLQNFLDPDYSLIDEVLLSKKGNPLSLSLIYSYIAQSLELPIFGVNLPNHFILAFMDENKSRFFINQHNEFGVLFYINVFAKGQLLDLQNIEDFLTENNLTKNRECYEPCSHSTIIKRMISNLIVSYQRMGFGTKVQELLIIRELFV